MWTPGNRSPAALRHLALVLVAALAAGCEGEVGQQPPGEDAAADQQLTDQGQQTPDQQRPGEGGPTPDRKVTPPDKDAAPDTKPADPSAYLHANLWSTWVNDRTRCGAERTYLRICQQRGGSSCSQYQQAVAACNPSKTVYGQVGPEKQKEKLCNQSKYPAVGGCVASKYDYSKLRWWWYGAEWMGNWPVATIKVFNKGVDWKGGGELIALSSVPGASQAAMSGIKNHGQGYGCAMQGKTSGSDADKYRRPFGGFAWIRVPTNKPVTVAAFAAANFGGKSFAGCSRGQASQSPWITSAPGATMGCIYVHQNVTFKPGQHYYLSHGQLKQLSKAAPPAELVAGFALPSVGKKINSRAACKL